MLGPVQSLEERCEGRITAVEMGVMEARADAAPTATRGSNSTPLQHVCIRGLLLS